MLNAFFFNTPIDNIYLGHQVAEIYKDKVYAPYLVGKKDLTIFDIGANIGMASYYFSQFAKEVHAFEPAKEHFEVIKTMLEYNKLSNVIPNNIAITNDASEAVLFHSSNKTMHSIRPAEALSTSDSEKVTTMRLDTYIKSRKIDHVDFMKIDVEGLEPEIICGDGFQNIADKVDMVFMEMHEWMGRNTNQLRDALKIAGFKNVDMIANDAHLVIARK